MSERMPTADHLRAIRRIGLPLIGSHVAQFAITLTDTIMLGWYDVEDLAAQVLGSTLFMVLFLMGAGFSWAVMPMVASAISSGNSAKVRRVTRMGLWASFAFSVLCLPVFLWASDVFRLLGQAEDTALRAGTYLSVAGFGIVPALLVMVLKSYLAALERTQVVLWVTLAGVGVNMIANYALIFGAWGAPELGLLGAAIASLAVQVVSIILLVTYVWRTTPEHAIFQRIWRPDWEAFGEVFRLGWPIGLTTLAEVGLFAASSIMLGWLGTIQLAAHGIALQITSLTFMVHVGLSNVATVRAGQAEGKGDLVLLKDGARVVLGVSAVFVLLTMIVFLTSSKALIGVFVSPSEPARAEVLRIGSGLLWAAALFQLADAAQVMALGLLRGGQDTGVAMTIASISYWVIGIPTSYVLGFVLGFGGVGVWLGLALGLAVAGIFMLRRFWQGYGWPAQR